MFTEILKNKFNKKRIIMKLVTTESKHPDSCWGALGSRAECMSLSHPIPGDWFPANSQQSLDEPAFAMPVINPLIIKEDYDPEVDDDVLKDIQPLTPENMLVLVTMTIPHELKDMTINLRGPILINSDTRKGAQIIVDDESCPVKFEIYDILDQRKKQAEAAEGNK